MNLRRHLPALALLWLAVTLFYARVIFDPRTTLQWDAAGYFYPYQKYFSDSIRAGRLPVWTSVLFSGFPFLADIQVGAWYPLNWPFFLAGIGPKSVFWELWLHALVAVAGAYALGYRLLGNRRAAALAGLIYGLSGYFCAHSEHVCLFQAAAWLPWLLLGFDRALERPNARRVAVLALTGGLVALAGHFQTALYSYCAAGLWGASRARLWRRALAVYAVLLAASAALAMIATLPGAELAAWSLRARLSAADYQLGILGWRSLATFVWPNALGVFEAAYRGPADITQHYFYAGALLVPLAALGFLDKTVRRVTPWLILAAVLYSIGLYRVLERLPGFSSVRAPSHSMFVAILGLALAAGAGARRIAVRRWALPALCVVFLLDLGWWNMLRTRLVYARGSYTEIYGPGERWFADMVRPPLPPLERLAAPGRWDYFYPASAPLAFPVETTFGANALMPARYYDYLVALNANPTLMSALGVSRYFDRKEWRVHAHTPALPRFYFPPEVARAPDDAAALALLKTVDAARVGVLTGGAGTTANGLGAVKIEEASAARYRLRVEAPAGGLLRVALPGFPGWRAEIDGRPAAIVRVDYALMGLEIPAGRHEVRLHFRPTWLAAGASLSLAALAACLAALVWGEARHA